MLHLPRKVVSANDKDLSFQQIAVPKVLSEEVPVKPFQIMFCNSMCAISSRKRRTRHNGFI